MNIAFEVASPTIPAAHAYLFFPGAKLVGGAIVPQPGNVRFVDVDGVADQPLRGYVLDAYSQALLDEIAALGSPQQLGSAGREGLLWVAPAAVPTEIAAAVKKHRWRGNCQDGVGTLIAADVTRTLNIHCPAGMVVVLQNRHASADFTADLGVSFGWDCGLPEEGPRVAQVV